MLRILLLLVTGFVLGEVFSQCDGSIMIGIASVVLLISIRLIWTTKQKKKRWLLLLPFLLLFGWWFYGYFSGDSEVDRMLKTEQAGILEGTICKIHGKTSGDVITLRDCIFISFQKEYYLPGEIEISYLDEVEQLLIGNSIRVTGELLKIEPPTNYGQFNRVVYCNSRNIYYQFKGNNYIVTDNTVWRYHNLLRRIREETEDVYVNYLGQNNAGIISAMVLGQKTYLEEERKELYQRNGIAHILAISGLHISMIGMMVYRRMRKWFIPAPICAFVSIWLLISYGILSGMGGASIRAIIMLMVTIIGDGIGRTPDLLTSMSLAGLLMLLHNPIQLYDAGFLLSYGAIIGIGGIGPVLNKIIPGRNSIIQGFRSGLAVQLATIPILLYFYYEIAPYSILINILVVPLMSILLPCGIAMGIGGTYIPITGELLRVPINIILWVYDGLCNICEKLPGSTLIIGKPDITEIIIYYGVLALVIYGIQRKHRMSVGMVILSIIVSISFIQKDKSNVSMLDVGQGDCIYLYTGEKHYLIDGGSTSISKIGQYRIEPFLKAKGVGRLDGIFITHMDEDHISGVRELLERGYMIDNLILGDVQDKTQYEEIVKLAEKNNTMVQYMAADDLISDGESVITCMHPPSGYKSKDINACSIVLDISIEKQHMLFTGDLGSAQEEELLANPYKKSRLQWTDYNILKVGHHGSKNSSCQEFLEIVKPKISIISCGKDNSYGHPHDETIDRLREIGSDIYITTNNGEIDVCIEQNKSTIDCNAE